MRASSDTISELAAAMAKAQAELVNPIKSLTAVLERGRNGMGPISYRYAPLSAGLDIVRKTLGKHELAAIQTTRIDPDRGLVLLTTTIAHSSGEWMSGVWPVCHITDMGHPKLMGAALTYARRYSLFTLVGLAGEDDLDGPPLEANDNIPKDAGQKVAEISAADFEPAPSANPADEKNSGGAHQQCASPPHVEAPSVAPVRKREPPTARRRSPRGPVAALVTTRSADPWADLAEIHDADALLRWAAVKMPERNKLDAAGRVMFDAAFLAKADAVGVEAELLIPFEHQREATKTPNGQASSD
jgi:ERF superfamily protein